MLRIALLVEGLQHMVASAHDVGVVLGTCWRLHTGVEHGKGSVSHHVPSSILSLCVPLPRPASSSVSPFLCACLPLWNEMETRKKSQKGG